MSGVGREVRTLRGGAFMIVKKAALIPVLLFAIVFMSGCAIKTDGTAGAASSEPTVTQTTDTIAASETTLAEITAATTEAALTPVPSPAASPSLGDGEYMILPGESAYYNVFDSSGKVIGSFFYNDEEEPSPVGIYDEKNLAKFYNEHTYELKAQIPAEDTATYLYTSLNGLYQINYDTDEVILYDKDGKKVCDIKDPLPSEEYKEICVKVIGGETVVAYQLNKWNEDYFYTKTSVCIYFVAPDGTINNVCKAVDLPGQPVGLIGRQYFIVSTYTSDGARPINTYDFSGNPVDRGVEVMQDYRNTLFTSEAAMSIYIGDYYIKGLTICGPDLKPVEADTLDMNGKLICGIVYHVNGIECIASTDYYNAFNYFENTDSPNAKVAVGYKGDTVSLKTEDWEFSADLPGYRFVTLNENTIIFTEAGRLHLISRSTGQETAVLENNPGFAIAGQYVIVYETGHLGFYILDKDGNRCYSSSESTAEPTAGEYIVLYRGPYIGIADLDGNWIGKALTWELTRDDQYFYRG
jgi:hypothetical protein